VRVAPTARARRLAPVVALLALVAAGEAAATASNKELEAQAAELDARLRTVERANQSLVQLSQQIDAARQELRKLRGEIEQLQNELETARREQRDLYGDLDRRLLLLESGPLVPVPAGLPTNGEPPTSTDDLVQADEVTVYGDAFAALKAGRYDEARTGFTLYLAKYPQGDRADNAHYWLGETLYVQKDYTAALQSFQRVVSDFPTSRKAPDAQLKVGFCQYELKAFRNARATLESVAVAYPGSEVERLARQRLARMDGEGR
jgi:tol-pal system protein YbgF